MFVEICLAMMTLALVTLVVIFVKISSATQKSLHLLQKDIQAVSKETTHLINTIHEFVQADLHAVSQDSRQLISELHDLSSDIKNKSYSLNFLFKPLRFLSSKLGVDAPSSASTPHRDTIPHILKWIASSALLFKKIREFKNHER